MFRVLFAMSLTAVAFPASGQTAPPLKAPASGPIRGAHYPALSPDGRKICFEYLGDLWTVPTSGGTAARLTVHRAYDAYPHWSPDGNWIAFSSNRQGNFDIYLVPSRGGESRQMTFNSSEDIVQDWSPDGSEILFSSARDSRYSDLYRVNVKDGRIHRVTDDKTGSRYACFGPTGTTIAYTRGRQEWWRPKYKGSANTDIYTIASVGGKTQRLTTYDGFDAWPLYSPDATSIFFVSDRSGISNLWRMSPGGENPEQMTRHTEDCVRFPSISRDGSVIAYECNFKIWTIPASGTLAKLSDSRTGAILCGMIATAIPPAAPTGPVEIRAVSDVRENLTQRVTMEGGVTAHDLSPDGKTLAFVARGELWICPVAGGDANRLTKSGVSQYSPTWSADGSMLAYVTDRNGNLDIYMMDAKTHAEKQVTLDPADDISPAFGGDGRLLSFIRTGGAEPGLYVLPLTKTLFQTESSKLASDTTRIIPTSGIGSYEWSPDGRWIVYSKRDATGTSDLWIIASVGGTPVNITRYPGSNISPLWSRDGRRIVFLSSRGSAGTGQGLGLYTIDLNPQPPPDGEAASPNKDAEPSPPGAADDAQRGRGLGRPPDTGGAPPPVTGATNFGAVPRAANVRIDFDDIHNRAKPLAIPGNIGGIALAPDARTIVCASNVAGQVAWLGIDITTGSTTRMSTGGEVGGNVIFSPDNLRFYFIGPGGGIYQLPRGAFAPARIGFNAVMDVDRRIEVAEAFNEAWRNLRTHFYDPKMHGADWVRLRAKYEPILAETAAKEDFAWLLSAMIGELNASHLGVTPPPDPGPAVVTGSLGARFDSNYGGPGLKVSDVTPRGPCDQIGKRIELGEYILAIDGEDVRFAERMYRTLDGKVDKTVELTVNNKPVKEGSRIVKVRPITRAAVEDLEYERWVRTRREKVDALSGGKFAYLHIRAMDQPSLRRFERELFGDAQSKEGLVLDVRFNGGGRIHDDLLALLIRKPHIFEVPRDRERQSQPFQVWNRPSILLINEYSASDAEIFPNGFREYGLGKLVGVPTYGAVIGTNNITLVDGTSFRIPSTGWYTLSGKNLENWGVPPDIRVEMSPEDNAEDNDKQLEAAVKALTAQMAAR